MQLSEFVKLCAQCRQRKALNLFVKDKQKASGLASVCKECKNKKSFAKRRAAGVPIAPPPTQPVKNGFKVCRKCSVRKPAFRFKERKEKKDGLSSYCYDCENKYCRERLARMGETAENATLTYWKYRVNTKHLRGVTAEQVKALYEKQPFCSYCKIALKPKEAQLEHKTPRCLGGQTTLENLDIACVDCNWLKRERTELEFRAFLNVYVKRFHDAQRQADMLDWAERGCGT